MSEYLRMSGIYWGLTVMDLMGQLHRMNREEILVFIKSCQHECGGISASIGHDPHLLYTLSAVQVGAGARVRVCGGRVSSLLQEVLPTRSVMTWHVLAEGQYDAFQRR